MHGPRQKGVLALKKAYLQLFEIVHGLARLKQELHWPWPRGEKVALYIVVEAVSSFRVALEDRRGIKAVRVLPSKYDKILIFCTSPDRLT